jgi:hypothetical protein
VWVYGSAGDHSRHHPPRESQQPQLVGQAALPAACAGASARGARAHVHAAAGALPLHHARPPLGASPQHRCGGEDHISHGRVEGSHSPPLGVRPTQDLVVHADSARMEATSLHISVCCQHLTATPAARPGETTPATAHRDDVWVTVPQLTVAVEVRRPLTHMSRGAYPLLGRWLQAGALDPWESSGAAGAPPHPPPVP